ncbi:hypothetical protein BDM02DRAFT_3122680 [Thelephora ganbajun]|uniref:Uncharacterized protein n=1 Tax=Thelephora ganbajun TaxID=370292 RepID=A0ACB6Z2N1_THEGA|nr:hypothetical protein BDM02DRAFT_3122680 [Thelephora ganbajun]
MFYLVMLLRRSSVGIIPPAPIVSGVFRRGDAPGRTVGPFQWTVLWLENPLPNLRSLRTSHGCKSFVLCVRW